MKRCFSHVRAVFGQFAFACAGVFVLMSAAGGFAQTLVHVDPGDAEHLEAAVNGGSPGDIILIPAGTYDVHHTLRLKPGMELHGDGAEATILRAANLGKSRAGEPNDSLVHTCISDDDGHTFRDIPALIVVADDNVITGLALDGLRDTPGEVAGINSPHEFAEGQTGLSLTITDCVIENFSFVGLAFMHIGPDSSGFDSALVAERNTFRNNLYGIFVANALNAGGTIHATLADNDFLDNAAAGLGGVAGFFGAQDGHVTVESEANTYQENKDGIRLIGGSNGRDTAKGAIGNTLHFRSTDDLFIDNGLSGVLADGGLRQAYRPPTENCETDIQHFDDAEPSSNNHVQLVFTRAHFEGHARTHIDAIAWVDLTPQAAGVGMNNTIELLFDPLSLASATVPTPGWSPTGSEVFDNFGSFDASNIVSVARLIPIDIKPGSSPATINLGSQGNVPVAILSTPDFDATQLDPLSVDLASAAVNLKGNGTPMASFQDVNGDGLLDLVVHMDTTALELTVGEVEATLSADSSEVLDLGSQFGGKVFDPLPVRGADMVQIIHPQQ